MGRCVTTITGTGDTSARELLAVLGVERCRMRMKDLAEGQHKFPVTGPFRLCGVYAVVPRATKRKPIPKRWIWSPAKGGERKARYMYLAPFLRYMYLAPFLFPHMTGKTGPGTDAGTKPPQGFRVKG